MNHQLFCASEYGDTDTMSEGFDDPNPSMKGRDRITEFRER